MSRLLKPLFITILLLLSHSAHARFANIDEAPIKVLFMNKNIDIAKDGTYEAIIEEQIEILNESGRNQEGSRQIIYNNNIEKIEILEAKTIIGDKEYKVAKDHIEKKPLASSVQGFDQSYQILISYPKVVVGSRLCLKYKLTRFQALLPNYYSGFFTYGLDYIENANINIKSRLPFNILVNNPENALEITEKKDNKYQYLNMKLNKPIYKSLINEPNRNKLEDEFITWVEISTLDNIQQLSNIMAPEYERVIQQGLPSLLEEIKREAKLIDNEIDQINFITSNLNKKIRYMGDWRSIKGGYYPRSLTEIVQSGVADCKEFSAATAAILTKLGVKANAALVLRQVDYINPTKSLPSLHNFNHAIIKINTKEGKTLWIDPTNFVSMAGGIFHDIAARPALVLDSCNPSYDIIPNIAYKTSKVEIYKTLEIKDNNLGSFNGEIKFKNETASFFTGIALFQSTQNIEEELIEIISGDVQPINKKVILPDLTSRIVKDINIKLAYTIDNFLVNNNIGIGISLNSTDTHYNKIIKNTNDNQEGATFLGEPMSRVYTLLIKNVKANNLSKFNYNIQSPWIKISRSVEQKGNDVELKEQGQIIKNYISAKDIKSKKYKKFRDDVRKFTNKAVLIVNKIEN